MTITPTDPTSPSIVATGPAGASDPTSAGGFLAAILQALTSLGSPPEADTAPRGDADDASSSVGATIDPSALGVVVPPALAGQLGSAVAGPRASAPGHANVVPGADGASADTTSDIRMSGDAVASAPGTARGDTGAMPGRASAETRPSTQAAAGDHSGQDQTAGSPGGPDLSQPVAQQPAAEVGSTAPVTAALTGQTVSTPAVGAVSTSGADPTPAQPVTRQVFPEVTSLATRGDGTHRITLTLKPEALGEVRVVMTVRDGAVHVRLAAGHEAQHALREGSPELTRLLAVAGASESRITVRDLPAAPASSVDTSPDLGADQRPQDQPPQDQHAGTRAHDPATDGTHDGTRHRRGATGANPPQSNEPVTHARAAGVDVTM